MSNENPVTPLDRRKKGLYEQIQRLRDNPRIAEHADIHDRLDEVRELVRGIQQISELDIAEQALARIERNLNPLPN